MLVKIQGFSRNYNLCRQFQVLSRCTCIWTLLVSKTRWEVLNKFNLWAVLYTKHGKMLLYTGIPHVFLIQKQSNEVFSHHTCGHKKLCSMQVVFLFLVFLNLIRNILYLIAEKNAYKKCKQTMSILNRMQDKTVIDQYLATAD